MPRQTERFATVRTALVSSQDHTAQHSALSARAVVLALTLVAVLSWLAPYNDSVLRNTFLAGTSFPMAPFGLLLILAVPVNMVLARRGRGVLRAFSAAELMVVWAVMVAASGIPGSGLLRMLVPQAAGYKYGITPDNHWEDRLGPHLKPWMYVEDTEAATQFFAGVPDGHAIPWAAWAKPALGYGVLILGVFLGSFCLASILRKQWVEREKFPFPLVAIPLEVARESERHRGLPPIFAHPLFLATASCVVALHAYAGLCRLMPSLGTFNWTINTYNVFVDHPWRYLPYSVKVARVYPTVIGLCYPVNTEVLLSMWLMKLVTAAQEVYFGMRGEYGGEVAFGWDPAYECYPQLGAYIALAAWIAWAARRHIALVCRAAFGQQADDADEPMSYRLAAWGFVLGCLLLLAWFVAAGVRVWVGLTVIAVYFAIATSCSWLVCQGGQMLVAARTVPSDTIIGVFGKWIVTDREIVVMPIFESPFSKDLREILMPSVANVTRAADAGVRRRAMMAVAAVGVLVALIVGAQRRVAIGYHEAAATLPDSWAYRTAATLPFDFTAGFVIRDFPTNVANYMYFLSGVTFVLGCLILRSRFLWFRLHPGGLCIAASFAGDVFWFSLLLGWALKSTILYFGGRRLLVATRPLFYGMVVGDAISWVVWMIVGLVVQDPARTYSLMPL